jgi:acylphosphatase
MKVRVHIWVSGHVQGVSFRYYTKDMANHVGVGGWVRNLPDGRVEAVFEGEEDKVKQVIEFIKKGPSGARVRNVQVHNEKPVGEHGFDIEF